MKHNVLYKCHVDYDHRSDAKTLGLKWCGTTKTWDTESECLVASLARRIGRFYVDTELLEPPAPHIEDEDLETLFDVDWEKDNILFFDLETTGVGNTDEILQMSFVDKDGNTLLDEYCKPLTKFRWPEAEKVNHISPEMVQGKPHPRDYIPVIQRMVDSADYLAGYNVNFDIRFLKNLGVRCDKPVLDAFTFFKKLHPETKGHQKLTDASYFYTPELYDSFMDNAHNSLADIVATKDVLYAQYLEVKKANSRELIP